MTVKTVVVPNQGPLYTPGSMVKLTCSAGGGFGPLVTKWTSTCTGSCFILQQSALDSITTNILQSVDGGNHTCTVLDDVGNSGSATIEMVVSGMCAIIETRL